MLLCPHVYFIPARITPGRENAGTIAMVRRKKRIAATAKWQLDCLRPSLDSPFLSLLLHNGPFTMQSISATGRRSASEFRLCCPSREYIKV
ncbi:hypothetical protein NPIL_104031 [Nephila pilipes]|uniref:Uncharacterized protein n=1 Tax=Nephila pilipes TaxID=299642 RepID=A0A8X6NPB2_NEPPI|nr:hypothetical protein NPIL_104031 [Nephila pilipes]